MRTRAQAGKPIIRRPLSGRALGLNPVDVEEKLTLFLALLVEVGAASGWFFATSHMRERGEETAPASSVATIIIDGKAFKVSPWSNVTALP